MMVFERMARRHWAKYLPHLTKVLKEEGKFEEETSLAAEKAARELAYQVAKGAQLEATKDLVLKTYILLEPEEDYQEQEEDEETIE